MRSPRRSSSSRLRGRVTPLCCFSPPTDCCRRRGATTSSRPMRAVEDLRRVNLGQDPAGLLTWDRFFEALRSTAGRRLLIVDTCAGRGIEGNLRRAVAEEALSVRAFRADGELEERRVLAGVRCGPSWTVHLCAAARLQTVCEGACAKNVTLEKLSPSFHRGSPNRQRRDLPQTPQLNAPVELRELVLAQY